MMSDDPHHSASPPAESSAAESLRDLRHDLRHSLYVLDLALTLLGESRADEARFAEVMQMLRKEQSSISQLVEQLLACASAHESAGGPPPKRDSSAT